MNGQKAGTQPENRVAEVYTTKNLLIKWLANRFFDKVYRILKKINSFPLNGLEVGCGKGYLLSRLYEKGAVGRMAAIEIDAKWIKYAKKYHPVCSYFMSDVYKLNFKANSFDYIIATEILEHLTDPVAAIKEIRRVSKINADIIISVPFEPFFHWSNLLRGKHLKKLGRTPEHVNFWSRGEIKTLLNEFIEIQEEYSLSTFPWLLFHGRFKPGN